MLLASLIRYMQIEPRQNDCIDLYFFGYGHDYKGCLRDFYHLSGQVPLLPRFALGNWWSRFYPYTEESYRALMEKFREQDIPLSVAVLDMDWHLTDIPRKYGSGWTGYTWNREFFPDPKRFLNKLHEMGLHITLNVHPADGVRAHEDAYLAMAEALGADSAHEDKIPFEVTDRKFMEAYFKYLHHPHEEAGVDFWWIDWQQGKRSAIGKVSGIDAAIYANTDTGTAQKILSLARYLVATNGQPLPGITTWQYTHPLPYEDGISEGTYHELFQKIGRDETLMQNFFAARLADAGGKPLLAYDSTTISTESGRIAEARYGFNKAQDGKETVKLLVLYSVATRQPVAFAKQPGNLPDVITIENALQQLSAIGAEKAELVTDNGYYSEKNLMELLHAHFDFLTLVKTSLKWVRKELDTHRNDFRSTSSACPFDINTHGVTVMRMQEFSRPRKHANRKKGRT